MALAAGVLEITDEKMLTSESYRLYLQKIARAQSGNYLLRVIFGRWPQTDGSTIWLLPNADMYNGLTLAQRTLCVMGNLAHEFAHVRWTDFEAWKERIEQTQKGIKRIASAINLNKELRLLKQVFNTTEDSFIEHAALSYYKGMFYAGINAKNDVFWAKHPSQKDMAKRGASKLELAMAYMLEDAKYHRIKAESPDDDVQTWFHDTRPLWAECMVETDGTARIDISAEILRTLLQWVNDDPGKAPEDLDSHMLWIQGSNDPEEIDPSHRQKMEKSAKKIFVLGSGDSDEEQEPGEADADAEGQGLGQSSGDDTEDEAEGTKGSDGEDEKNESPSDSEGEAETSSGETGDKGEESQSTDESGDESQSPAESEDDNDSKPSDETGEGTDDAGSSDEESAEDEVDPEEEMKQALENLSKDLEQVKSEEQAREVDTAEANARRRQLQALASKSELRSVHSQISLRVQSMAGKGLNAVYYEGIQAMENGIIRIGSKKLKELIRTNEDRKTTGLMKGKIQQNALHRADKRVFYERSAKSEEKDLVIGLLYDESGSMKGRQASMVAAGVFFMELAESLKVSCGVYGHNAPYGHDIVNLRVYKDFDDPTYYKHSITHMSPDSGTRDGVALAWMEKRMLQLPQQDKILICISDGEPHHYGTAGYRDSYDPVRMTDTLYHLKRLKQKGIQVIGLCIGEEAKSMRELYPVAIDIPDVSALTTAFVRIVKNNLFK